MTNKKSFYSGMQHIIDDQIERILNLQPLLLILHKNGVTYHKELSKQMEMTEEELGNFMEKYRPYHLIARWTVGPNPCDKTYRLTDTGIEYCLSKYGAE